MRYEPLQFSELSGWQTDQLDGALAAFENSFVELLEVYPGLPRPGSDDARAYFETHFLPHRIIHDGPAGFFTGYYEPVLKGARRRTERFSVPLLRRPDDLVTLIDDSLRASSGEQLTHARQCGNVTEAYPVREQIERGCLDGQGLELIYLEDPVDAFFLHVQGSGVIDLDDGDRIRVGYAAKNGHPYTSVGQELIAERIFAPEDMNLAALVAWLKADRKRAQPFLWRNKSYIFFEERNGDAATGVKGTPLITERSLAIDASCHAIGLPIFISVPGLKTRRPTSDYNRLMVAHDVGSAIRGAERGDIFFGTGPEAGQLAGTTRHTGHMYVLLPRNVSSLVDGPERRS